MKTLKQLESFMWDYLPKVQGENFSDEKDFEKDLMTKLQKDGFDVESQLSTQPLNDDEKVKLFTAEGAKVPDLVVKVEEGFIPIELKFDNTPALYKADNKKIHEYVEHFSDVPEAWCIFLDKHEHKDYNEGWKEINNSSYRYKWLYQNPKTQGALKLADVWNERRKNAGQGPKKNTSPLKSILLILALMLGIGNVWAISDYFNGGETMFIIADGNGAWADNACVKTAFSTASSSQDSYITSRESTTWLWDGNWGDQNNKKCFYTIVPDRGDLKSARLERFPSDCSGDHWNWNGGWIKNSSRSNDAYNTFYSSGAGESNFGWKNATYSLRLHGATNSWNEAGIGTLVDRGNGVFAYSFVHTATATSYEFRIKDSQGVWRASGNTTLSGLTIGTKYIITATVDLKEGIGSLAMSTGGYSTHEPGVYETAAGSGGYGQTLKNVNNRDYEVYGFASAGGDDNYIYAGTTSTTYSDKHCLLHFSTTNEIARGWISNYFHSRGSTFTNLSASNTEFNGLGTSGSYNVSYQSDSKLTLNVSGYDEFAIWAKDNNTSTNHFIVKVDGVEQSMTYSNSSSGTRRGFSLSKGEHIIEVTTSSASNCTLWGFSLRVACTAPTALTASSLTTSGATLTVTDAENTNDYEFYVKTSSSAPDPNSTATYTVSSGKSKVISDLSAGTTYYAWARSKCSSTNKSDWVALTGSTFTTTSAGCTDVDAPTGLSCSSTTKNSLTFGWTAASNASSYDVYLYTDSECSSEASPTESNPQNVTTTSATFTGLSAGTTYYCKVQSKGDGSTYCSSGGTTSKLSATTKTVHSISFDANGGTGSLSTISGIEYGSSQKLTAIGSSITRTGWTFTGWNTDQYGGGTAYADQATVASVTANMTLYAQWEKTVYLKMGDGWDAASAWFAVWCANADASKQTWVAMTKAENCSDPAVYKATIPGNGYTKIIFVRKNPASATLATWDNKWNQTVDLAYSNLTSNNQYTITDIDGGGGDPAKSIGSWGTYSAPTYTISYATGTPPTGSASISGSKSSQTKNCGVDFTLPNVVFTLAGYTQDGWATSNGGPKAYNLGGSYTTESSQTFYPHWSANQYSVSHSISNVTKTSGATGASAATCGTNYTAVFAAADGYTLPASITVTIGGNSTTAGTEYTWTQGTGTVVVNGAYITGNIAITVAGIIKKTVTYKKNGGAEGADGSVTGSTTDASSPYAHGSTVTTKASGFTNTGYKFKWWNTAYDGSGEDFYVGEKFDITANTLLYAQWEEIGTGEEFWVGSPNVWHATTHDVTVGDMNIKPQDYSSNDNAINKDFTGGNKAYTIVNATDKRAIVMAVGASDKYVEISFTDGSTINELEVGVAAKDGTDPTMAVLYSTTSDFSSGLYYLATPVIPTIAQTSKQVTTVNPDVEDTYKYVRIYSKIYTAVYSQTGGSGNKLRIYSIKAKKGASCTSLDAPEGLSCTAQTKNSLTFGWSAAENASSYDVYLYSDAGCTSEVTPTEGKPYNVTSTSATLTGLTAGTTYYCKVRSKGTGDYCTNGAITTTAASGKTKYGVTYSKGGATSGTAPTDDNSYAVDAEVTVKDTTGCKFVYASHTFRGWTDGTTFYKVGQTFNMPNENVTLTAVWDSYSSGGGSGTIIYKAKINPSVDGTTMKALSEETNFTTANYLSVLEGGTLKLHLTSSKQADVSSSMVRLANDAAYWILGLNTALQAGDIIKYHVGSNSPSLQRSSGAFSAATDITLEKSNWSTVVVPNGMVGASTLYLKRPSGSNSDLDSIEIYRPGEVLLYMHVNDGLTNGNIDTDETQQTAGVSNLLQAVSGGDVYTGATTAGHLKIVNTNEIQLSQNTGYLKLVLPKALAEGDMIYFNSSVNYQISFTTSKSYGNSIGTAKKVYTIPGGSGLIGQSTIYVWYYSSTNVTNVKTLTVVRPTGGGGSGSWTNKYVAFDTNAGVVGAPSLPDTIKGVPSGKKIVQPADPTATGYTFVNWYPTQACNTAAFDWTGTITKDTTLYAKFNTPTTLIQQPAKIDGKRVAIDTLDAKNHPEIDSVIVHQLIDPTPYGTCNITYQLNYSATHTPLDEQPKIRMGKGAGVGYDTIWMPMNETMVYEIVAYLRNSADSAAGDLVTTDTALVSVEKTWPIKVRYVMDGVELRDPTEWPVYPSYRTTEIRVMKEQQGYVFDSLEYGVGITVDSVKANWSSMAYATYVKAANASTITAHYKVPDTTVYFFNTFDKYWYSTRVWKYEYGADGYWNGSTGSGADGLTGDSMKISSYDDENRDKLKVHLTSGKTKMSFTSRKMNGSVHFWGTKSPNEIPHVIYREDYNDALKMFVPVTTNVDEDYITMNKTETGEAHYYRGFWVRRSPDRDSTGYFLHVFDKVDQATASHIQSLPLRLTQSGANDTWELTATMDLEAGKTYGFKITKANTGGTVWLSYNGTLTSADHTGKVLDATSNNIGLTTTGAGNYTFHVFCKAVTPANPSAVTAAEIQGKLAVTVDYATLDGDFRVVYQDDSQIDLTDNSGVEPIASQSIRARANGQDTVTFFVRKAATNRVMKFQKFNGSTGAWDDVASGTIDLTNTAAQTFTVSTDTTYQIYLQQNADGTGIEATGMDYYSGLYYIRTDCVDEHKWDYMQSPEAHRLVESDYASHLSTDPFTHYYVHWVDKNKNVKFVVATQYSPTLTDTLITDTYANVAGGNLPAAGASVRFMYHKKTNWIKRAYLAGADGGELDLNFLKLTETSSDKMKNTSGSAISSITFSDLGNFTYQAEIKAQPGLAGKLTAEYNSNTQYFRGSELAGETILGGTGDSWQNIVMTYDFKTNRLICAWTPSGDSINGDMAINADIMIIRKGQDDAQQIVFKTNESKLSSVKYIYGVIQLDYNDLVGMMPTWDWWSYGHCMYYISFPFDVLVSDITGVGTIGQEWRLQRYNGAKRAEKGWFIDGEKTFWEDLHAGDTLKAYEGYSLLLNRTRFNSSSSSIWENKSYGSSVYLFFPSMNASTGIVADGSVTVHVPAHECTKDQTFINSHGMLVNHKVTDSHWNMLGTPIFADTTAFSMDEGPRIDGEYSPLQYVYAWNHYGNTLGIQLTLTTKWKFKAMYSYMVQYAGDVVFKGSTVSKIVAAHRNSEKKNYHVNLELTKDEQFIGRTYVQLRENAVDSFLLNEDIYMVRNGVNADLFTYAGGYEAGANVLPIADQTVQVGIAVKKAGTYVFSMPDNFDGEVTLVDTYAQTRTNLAIEDYEIALPTGEITDRFYLEININKTPTAIDGVTDGEGTFKDGKAHKFIMNDMMYILKDGALYDAQGKRVQ